MRDSSRKTLSFLKYELVSTGFEIWRVVRNEEEEEDGKRKRDKGVNDDDEGGGGRWEDVTFVKQEDSPAVNQSYYYGGELRHITHIKNLLFKQQNMTGNDACEGDSGGPLYIWVGHQTKEKKGQNSPREERKKRRKRRRRKGKPKKRRKKKRRKKAKKKPATK